MQMPPTVTATVTLAGPPHHRRGVFQGADGRLEVGTLGRAEGNDGVAEVGHVGERDGVIVLIPFVILPVSVAVLLLPPSSSSSSSSPRNGAVPQVRNRPAQIEHAHPSSPSGDEDSHPGMVRSRGPGRRCRQGAAHRVVVPWIQGGAIDQEEQEGRAEAGREGVGGGGKGGGGRGRRGRMVHHWQRQLVGVPSGGPVDRARLLPSRIPSPPSPHSSSSSTTSSGPRHLRRQRPLRLPPLRVQPLRFHRIWPGPVPPPSSPRPPLRRGIGAVDSSAQGADGPVGCPGTGCPGTVPGTVVPVPVPAVPPSRWSGLHLAGVGGSSAVGALGDEGRRDREDGGGGGGGGGGATTTTRRW